MTDDEKETKLLNLVDVLCDPSFSKDAYKINSSINTLTEVYTNGYRHSYYGIFHKLQSIFTKDDMEISSTLGENLNTLSSVVKDKMELEGENLDLKNAAKGLKKFSDHINLEIGRYSFIKNHFALQSADEGGAKENLSYSDLSKKVEDLSSAVEKVRPITEEAKKSIASVDDKLARDRLSSITTLTIFSAVILAFSGGITFESGVFSGIAEASAYRIVFITSLTGFILFNTIFALLYLIGKMTEKTISTKCKYMLIDKPLSYKNIEGHRACGDGICLKPCSGVNMACRIFHKYSYVCAINGILLWVMYSDFVLWIYKGISLVSFIYMGLPLLIMLIVPIVIEFSKWNQRKRIILKTKIEYISNFLNLYETPFGFLSIFVSKFKSSLGIKENNISEEFSKLLNTDDNDYGLRTVLKKVDSFIEDKILTEDKLADVISRRKHKLNKKKWIELEYDFRKFLISKKSSE